MKQISVLIILLLFSCKNTLDKEGLFSAEEYARNDLEYSDVTLFLPKKYIAIDKAEFSKRLFGVKDIPSNIIEMWISNIESPNDGITIFSDTTNPVNFILIKRLPSYIPVNYGTSKVILKLMKQYLEDASKNHGLIYHLGESTFKRNKGIEMYKLNYSSFLSGVEGNHTRYFIEINKQTFDIQIVNNENEDFEDEFKNIEIH